MIDHTAVAVREQAYVAFPYEDVICKRCGKIIGAFVGKAQCAKCGTVALVLTGEHQRA